MKRRTKIVCTLGPAVDTEEMIKSLIEAGMNVARLNCSHGDWETRRRWIEWVRKHSASVAPVAVLVDLQGPKFRIGAFAVPEIHLKAGQVVTLGAKNALIPVSQPEILNVLKKGSRVLLGDGDVELKISGERDGSFEAQAVSGGAVRSHQGLTVVGASFACEVLSKKDLGDIREACKAGADYIALSYVHTADDMKLLREHVSKHDPSIRLCAKIETRAAVNNIDAIVESSDVLMVARGDMGLQMDIEEVPLAQKKIIRACRRAAKPAITATQMLESMTHAPRPTRAEATDVANAILDGTDAVMLSGETAAGEYPLEAVRYMSRIAEKAETLLDRSELLQEEIECRIKMDHTEAVAHSVARLAQLIKPKAIVTSTTSGRTAVLVSKFRPAVPIYCGAWVRKVQCQLALVWGVEAIFVETPKTTDEQIANAVSGFVDSKRLKISDQVIVSAGVPPGTAGNTNLILVHTVKS